MKAIDRAKYYLVKMSPHFWGLLAITLIAAIVTYSNLGLTKEFIGDDASVGYHYPSTRLGMVFNMWNSYIFPGKSDTIGTISLIHISSIAALNWLGFSSIFIDRLYYFLFFFVSGIGMYFLAYHICAASITKEKNSVWLASLAGAVLYMLNNFTMILLSFPPTSYVYSYIFLPWIFLLYLKDFHISNIPWHRLIFVVISILLLSGNPSNTISIIFVLLIYELFFRKRGRLTDNFKKFVPTLLLILLMSSFIYFPVLGNKENPYGNVLSSDNRSSISFSSSTTSFKNLFILRGHHSQDTFVFNEFLLSNSAVVVNYILTITALTLLLRKKKSKIELFLFLTFILFLFLAKAEHDPLKWINRLIFDNIPLFEMYRASYFKFIYFCVFSISILFSISLLKISNEFLRFNFSFAKKIIFLCALYAVFISAKPFFQGEVARDIHKTTIPNEYNELRAYLSNLKTDFSVLSIPQLYSGLVLDWGNGNYYGGGHPDMFILDKPVWSNGWFLPKSQTSDQFHFYKSILYKSKIKYVLLHKDIPEKYSFAIDMTGTIKGQTNFNILNDQIEADKNFNLILDNKFFKIFEISHDKFNPSLYAPEKSIISNRDAEEFTNILSQNDCPVSSSVFLKNQNVGKTDILKSLLSEENDIKKSPVFEFKKINPTKYRVRIHSANGTFPLVFSESFHVGWKAYAMDVENKEPSDKLNGYKILHGNEGDQASVDELKEFIEKSWVTDLGDGKEKEIKHKKWENNKEELDYVEKYNIDFVSKNFQGTIQNDNLPAGHFWETWLQKPIEDNENHLTANGYANSWVMDVNKICAATPDRCIKNADGTYELEVIVEFWPQRLFYVGVGISGATLLACLGYLMYNYGRKKYAKSKKDIE